MSLARYESFLINNVSTISSLESTLRSLTWFLPGRFKDAELASEALSATLNAMSLYHDTILIKIVQSDPRYKPILPPSSQSKFTRAWSEKSHPYKWAARALELIRFTELVIEMGLRRKVSTQNRWRGIVLLEAIKAILRILLLKISRRPLVSPPIPERDLDPLTLPAPVAQDSTETPEHLQNNHIPVSPHLLITPTADTTATIENYLLPKALSTQAIKPSLLLIRAFSSPQDWLAELLYIFRPLVYASMLASNRNSNQPLVTALIMELVSRNLRRTPPASSVLERAEYGRRDRDILWYLLRGSIWDSYTRPKVEAIVEVAANVPLIGLLSAFVKDWIPLINEYYYYTAP